MFWYAIAIPGPFLLLLAAEAIDACLLGRAPSHWLTWPSFSGPGGLYLVIFGSLLAEEPGWGGFAQPRLQTRYGALTASIFIGLLWNTRGPGDRLANTALAEHHRPPRRALI